MNLDDSKKRKRLRNTTSQQYEIYLQALENDYALRSNTINPTMNPNYINNKWEELSNQLNAVGNGPALTVEEWKKRFADWKYATKAKHRKMQTHLTGTGGGPSLPVVLTSLEERGLDVWGRATVCGGSNITTYEGVPQIPDFHENASNKSIIITETEHSIERDEGDHQETIVIQVDETETTPKQGKKRIGRSRVKPLSILTENLTKVLSTNTNYTKTLTEQASKLIDLQKENIEIKRKKIKFEIQKFKFLNPLFESEF